MSPTHRYPRKIRHRVGVGERPARRRRSSHLAFTYGDVFERVAQTARELEQALS
jgi:hypothetical protein